MLVCGIKSIEFKRKYVYIKGTIKFKSKQVKWIYKILRKNITKCGILNEIEPIKKFGYKVIFRLPKITKGKFIMEWEYANKLGAKQ